MDKKQFSGLFFSLNCFYDYVTETAGISAVSFRFSDCTYDFVLGYSQFLQEQKKLAASTVNQRLAALKTYLKYVTDTDFSMVRYISPLRKCRF